MATFLVKSDPETYGLDELEKDRRTVWDGVKNPTALRHLRSIEKGDKVLAYHTGEEKAVVGMARAASDAYPDPKSKDGRLWAFDLEFVARAKHAVALKDIKADPVTGGLELVRLPRLSVMPVPREAFSHLCRRAGLKE